jgi:hypothetical protein
MPQSLRSPSPPCTAICGRTSRPTSAFVRRPGLVERSRSPARITRRTSGEGEKIVGRSREWRLVLTRAALVWAIAGIGVAGIVGGLLRSVGGDVTRQAALIPQPTTARRAPEPWPVGRAPFVPVPGRALRGGSLARRRRRSDMARDAGAGNTGLRREQSVASDLENSDDADEITPLATLPSVLEPPVDCSGELPRVTRPQSQRYARGLTCWPFTRIS